MSAADELRALTAAATPGPREPVMMPAGLIVDAPQSGVAVAGYGIELWEENAALIVWLVNHAAALADLAEAANVMADRYADEDALVESPLLTLRTALAALEADT